MLMKAAVYDTSELIAVASYLITHSSVRVEMLSSLRLARSKSNAALQLPMRAMTSLRLCACLDL